jgi:hypothetical protein
MALKVSMKNETGAKYGYKVTITLSLRRHSAILTNQILGHGLRERTITATKILGIRRFQKSIEISELTWSPAGDQARTRHSSL